MQLKQSRSLHDPLLSWLDSNLYSGSSHLRRRKAEQNQARSHLTAREHVHAGAFGSMRKVADVAILDSSTHLELIRAEL